MWWTKACWGHPCPSFITLPPTRLPLPASLPPPLTRPPPPASGPAPTVGLPLAAQCAPIRREREVPERRRAPAAPEHSYRGIPAGRSWLCAPAHAPPRTNGFPAGRGRSSPSASARRGREASCPRRVRAKGEGGRAGSSPRAGAVGGGIGRQCGDCLAFCKGDWREDGVYAPFCLTCFNFVQTTGRTISRLHQQKLLALL
uniref:Uncharacterized protein n=1 Tax=Setaria viridis TaxID=4556 RepID=A0A4U6V285_SETVI|nr:hypothetical protein SEVIR_4G208301v2 [Setaria viridis]